LKKVNQAELIEYLTTTQLGVLTEFKLKLSLDQGLGKLTFNISKARLELEYVLLYLSRVRQPNIQFSSAQIQPKCKVEKHT
jgi:hypothetical protein